MVKKGHIHTTHQNTPCGEGPAVEVPGDVVLSRALANDVAPVCLGDRIPLAGWMWRPLSLFRLLCYAYLHGVQTHPWLRVEPASPPASKKQGGPLWPP